MSGITPAGTSDVRSYLKAMFGPDWEMLLIAEGCVGGTNAAVAVADRARVVAIARRERPDLDEGAWCGAGVAWWELWCDGKLA